MAPKWLYLLRAVSARNIGKVFSNRRGGDDPVALNLCWWPEGDPRQKRVLSFPWSQAQVCHRAAMSQFNQGFDVCVWAQYSDGAALMIREAAHGLSIDPGESASVLQGAM